MKLAFWRKDGGPRRVRITRAESDRLEAMRRISERAEGDAVAYLQGMADRYGFDRTRVLGIDSGDKPAVLVKPPDG